MNKISQSHRQENGFRASPGAWEFFILASMDGEEGWSDIKMAPTVVNNLFLVLAHFQTTAGIDKKRRKAEVEAIKDTW